MISQDFYIFNMSIKENLLLANLNATDNDIQEVCKKVELHKYIESLPEKYETMIGENGVNLSGGQRQRISIARAILKDAPIILLDEASASLDVESETYVQRALSKLIQHKTVIMIAHRMRTIATASHLVVLENGKASKIGTHEELISEDGLYKKLWDIQGDAEKEFFEILNNKGVDLQNMSYAWKI